MLDCQVYQRSNCQTRRAQRAPCQTVVPRLCALGLLHDKWVLQVLCVGVMLAPCVRVQCPHKCLTSCLFVVHSCTEIKEGILNVIPSAGTTVSTTVAPHAVRPILQALLLQWQDPQSIANLAVKDQILISNAYMELALHSLKDKTAFAQAIALAVDKEVAWSQLIKGGGSDPGGVNPDLQITLVFRLLMRDLVALDGARPVALDTEPTQRPGWTLMSEDTKEQLERLEQNSIASAGQRRLIGETVRWFCTSSARALQDARHLPAPSCDESPTERYALLELQLLQSLGLEFAPAGFKGMIENLQKGVSQCCIEARHSRDAAPIFLGALMLQQLCAAPAGRINAGTFDVLVQDVVHTLNEVALSATRSHSHWGVDVLAACYAVEIAHVQVSTLFLLLCFL